MFASARRLFNCPEARFRLGESTRLGEQAADGGSAEGHHRPPTEHHGQAGAALDTGDARISNPGQHQDPDIEYVDGGGDRIEEVRAVGVEERAL